MLPPIVQMLPLETALLLLLQPETRRGSGSRRASQGGISTGVMRQRNKGCLRREAESKAGICFKAHRMDLSLLLASRS
ncbi:hypothetical protein Q7C36_015789 [Tachysurus vachellii]|uniref:Uncharacterized protein n=1 Tax=Tachysurus vachellii TaxID=175792 RepID=A0AA88M7V7_TACVA|nr:hypothetical protein Q7C36_015789 [Tachysurus vachellii]